MAKTKAAAKSANRSDVIREILKKNPKANVKDVQDLLAERGVKASNALINKIKYGRGPTGAGKKAKRRKGRGGVNKADAIRGAWGEVGVDGRPRDVIALLAGRGVAVTSAQVSTLRKGMSKKRGPAVSPTVHAVPFEHLVLAKGLAARLGGIENAQQALASLSKLMNA
ncbi:MAG: hypothetical protein WD845_05490 [Pirellulales bacterium]